MLDRTLTLSPLTQLNRLPIIDGKITEPKFELYKVLLFSQLDRFLQNLRRRKCKKINN